MKLLSVKTETYDVGEGFMVDVVENGEEFVMWITHKDHGTKQYCFGSPIQNWQWDEPHKISKDEFLEMVEANLPEYIEEYREEVMGEDI